MANNKPAKNREHLSLPKNFSASQVNWVGIATFCISVLGFVQSQELVAQYPKVVSGIGAVIGILIVVVRLFDTQPVRLPFSTKAPSDTDSNSGDENGPGPY